MVIKLQQTAIDRVKRFINILGEVEVFYSSASLSYYSILSFLPLIIVITHYLTSYEAFYFYYDNIKDIFFNDFPFIGREESEPILDGFVKSSSKISKFSIFVVFLGSFIFFENYISVLKKIFKEHYFGNNIFTMLSIYMLILFIMPIFTAFGVFVSDLEFLKIPKLMFLWKIILVWVPIFTFFVFAKKEFHKSLKELVISSLITSFVWMISKNIFFEYTNNFYTYKTIYGSLGNIVLMFIWIYASWSILISGLCFYKLSLDKFR